MRKKIILQQQKKKTVTPMTSSVNNQAEEVAYFNAYLLPLSEKANLQTALNTYGSIRLQAGDYRGVNLVMSSNQKLYGSPSFLSMVSSIILASGSSGIVIEDVFPVDTTITIQAGLPVTNCTLKSIKWARLVGTNVMFLNNTLINFQGSIQIDCSVSGYLRNNKIIRQQSGGNNAFVFKGNNTTPSYGNVSLWANYLTPHGDTTDLNTLQSHTFVGLDAESWNSTNEGTKAMLHAQNIGRLNIADFNGGNNSTYKTPSFDIDALETFFFNKKMEELNDVFSLRSNVGVFGGNKNYIRKNGVATGFDFIAKNNVVYNNTTIASTIVDLTIKSNIKKNVLAVQGISWEKPSWNILPDILGLNWSTDRVGKPDSTTYIQNLINTNGIAELPEGIYYTSSTLFIPSDRLHGILGKGTGKTVICALTDTFPLISIDGGYGIDGNFVLSYLTLQGGTTGIYASTDYGGLNFAYQSTKFVIFRNQVNGIHLNKTGGFDNCFFDNVSFVNCGKGFYQQPDSGAGEGDSAYVDKTVFYNSQFKNCTIPISMLATRADNLNAWINCKFDGGSMALDLASQNAPIIANCDISNFTGTHVISSNSFSMYNTDIHDNNISISTIKAVESYIEGCNLLDNDEVFSPVIYNPIKTFVLNSVVQGNVIPIIPINQGFYPQSAIFSNSLLLNNNTYNKLLVNINNGANPLILIDETPTPYPQLLVTQ